MSIFLQAKDERKHNFWGVRILGWIVEVIIAGGLLYGTIWIAYKTWQTIQAN